MYKLSTKKLNQTDIFSSDYDDQNADKEFSKNNIKKQIISRRKILSHTADKSWFRVKIRNSHRSKIYARKEGSWVNKSLADTDRLPGPIINGSKVLSNHIKKRHFRSSVDQRNIRNNYVSFDNIKDSLNETSSIQWLENSFRGQMKQSK